MATLEEKKARLAELQAMAGGEPTAPVNAAPDGPMTLEQKKARLAELQRSASGQPAKEEEPWYEDFGEGLAVSGMETYYGVKDLVTDLDDEDKATLADWQQDAGESGWGTAGQVAGEVGQFLIPGGAVLKGAKAASRLAKLGRGARSLAVLGGESALGAGLGAARLPDADETRGGNALTEGAGALAGGVAGKVLAKTLRGASRLPAAKKLMDKGVELTPGAQSGSKVVTGLENVMEVTPFLARGTKKAKEKALNQWNKVTLNEAAPVGAKITETGTAGAKQLKDAVTKAYDDAWKGAGRLRRKDVTKMMEGMRRNTLRLGKADERVMQSMWDDVEKLIADGSRKGFQSADDMLRRRIKAAGTKKYDLNKALSQAREDLRATLDPDTLGALKKIDSKYPAYLTAKQAVKNAKNEPGRIFKPTHLVNADSQISKDLATTGESVYSKAADEAQETLGHKVGGQPLEWFRRVADIFPTTLPLGFMGRGVMGDTMVQKAGKAAISNPTVRALRRRGLSSALGAGATD